MIVGEKEIGRDVNEIERELGDRKGDYLIEICFLI